MPPPKGRRFPFAPRHSVDWLVSHVTYDQAVDMFFNQTATQQNLGHDPLIYSKVFRGVTYATIQEAQQVFTETMNAEYEAREQRDLVDENRGCKASKMINDNIRNRIVPTENGLESLTAYRKPFGEKCMSPISLFTKSLNGGSNSHIQANETQTQLVNPTQSAAQQAYDFPQVTKGSKAIQALNDSWGLQYSLECELKNSILGAELESRKDIMNALLADNAIIKRKDWHAKPSKNNLDYDYDYDSIVIHHAGNSYQCSNHVADIQTEHLKDCNEAIQKTARLTGILYLLLVPLGIFGIIYTSTFTVSGDPATTAANITSSKSIYQLSILAAMACGSPRPKP